MEKNIYKNENLSKYSWFNLGGPAEILFKPKDEIDLKEYLVNLSNKKKIHILGAGSNTLFRDQGFDGVIIKLGKSFSFTKLIENNKIEVGSGTLDKKVSDFAYQKSLGGFEYLSCIPGSIGGAIKMNSGCYGYDISKNFISLKAMDFNGEIKVIEKNQIKFFYRGNNLANDLIILSVILAGEPKRKKILKIRETY